MKSTNQLNFCALLLCVSLLLALVCAKSGAAVTPDAEAANAGGGGGGGGGAKAKRSDCFLNYEAGKAYYYEFSMDMYLRKSQAAHHPEDERPLSAAAVPLEKRSEPLKRAAAAAAAAGESSKRTAFRHARAAYKYDVEARLVAHGVDHDGHHLFELLIDDVAVEDENGWQDWGKAAAVLQDPNFLSARMMKHLRAPFYFSWKCNGDVEYTWHGEASDEVFDESSAEARDDADAINTKKRLIGLLSQAIAHREDGEKGSYERTEHDSFGSKRVKYVSHVAEDGSLRVERAHNETREARNIEKLPRHHGGPARPDSAKLGQDVKRTTQYENGVIKSIEQRSRHIYPAPKSAEEEAAEEARRAQLSEKANMIDLDRRMHIQMRMESGSDLRARLVRVAAVEQRSKRELPEADNDAGERQSKRKKRGSAKAKRATEWTQPHEHESHEAFFEAMHGEDDADFVRTHHAKRVAPPQYIIQRDIDAYRKKYPDVAAVNKYLQFYERPDHLHVTKEQKEAVRRREEVPGIAEERKHLHDEANHDPTLDLVKWQRIEPERATRLLIEAVHNVKGRGEDAARSLLGESEQVRVGGEAGVLWRPDDSKKRDGGGDDADAAAEVEKARAEAEAAAAEVPDRSKSLFAVMNQLALGGTEEGEVFVLSVAADEERDWRVRNRALFALSMFRVPMQSTMDDVWAMAEDMRSSQAHTRRQARLVFGILVYNADKYGTRESDSGSESLKRDVDNRRKQIWERFLNAYEMDTIDNWGWAFQNTLKDDIDLPGWVNELQVLEKRGFARRVSPPTLREAKKRNVNAAKAAAESATGVNENVWYELFDGRGNTLLINSGDRATVIDRDEMLRMMHENHLELHKEVAAAIAEKKKKKKKKRNMVAQYGDDPMEGIIYTYDENGNKVYTELGMELNAQAMAEGTVPGESAMHEPGTQLNVSQRIKNFFQAHECKPVSKCSNFGYTKMRPPGEPEEDAGNQNIWNDTLGDGDVKAYVEALTDFRVVSTAGTYQGAQYEFFAGAMAGCTAYDQKVDLISAYAKGEFGYESKAGDLIGNCTTFKLHLYFSYTVAAYYLQASSENNCTVVADTCKTNYPPDEQISYYKIDSVAFYDPDPFELEQEWVEVTIVLDIYGEIGFNIYWGMQTSAVKGGSALNGMVEITGGIMLAASVRATLTNLGDDIRVWAEIGGVINLLSAGFPLQGGLNVNSYRGCASLHFHLSMFGGSLYLEVGVEGSSAIAMLGSLATLRFEIVRWQDPIDDLLPILEGSCCKECNETCYNAFCNYRYGLCECLIGYDGEGCDIECPPECNWPDTDGDGVPNVHPGVDCIPGGPRRSSCECKHGYYGWNCLLECPPSGVNPCSGHGICDSEGICTCDYEYYGRDCSVTCPDDEDGFKCGQNGRCIYTGVDAKCECFANYVGPNCTETCPLSQDDRQAPCGRHGDCTMLNGAPSCLCHGGYYGNECEHLDDGAEGSVYEFKNPITSISFNKQNNTEMFDELLEEGAIHYGFWIAMKALPEVVAEFFTTKFGQCQIQADGTPRICASDENNCVLWPMKLAADESWHYLSVAFEYDNGNTLKLRHYTAAQQMTPAHMVTHSLDNWPLWEVSGLMLASQLQGMMDLFSVIARPAALASDTFTEADIAHLRDELLPRHFPDLIFYLLFDLNRGYELYSQVDMRTGTLPEDAQGDLKAWVNSELTVPFSYVSSFFAEPFEVKSTPVDILYVLDLAGRKMIKATMEFFSYAPSACSYTIKICDRNAQGSCGSYVTAGTGSAVAGQGVPTVITFNAAALKHIRPGENIIKWSVSSGTCTVHRSSLGAQVPGTDITVEFGGSPFSFVRLDKDANTFSSGGWAMDFYVMRDPVLYTEDGILVGLKASNIDPLEFDPAEAYDGTALNEFSLLVYEQGGVNRGTHVYYEGHNAPIKFESYSVNVERWTHIYISAYTSGGACRLSFVQDGVEKVVSGHRAYSVGSCTNVKPKFLTNAAFELRLGESFGGQINDFSIWSTSNLGWSAVSDRMWVWYDYTTQSNLKAFTFETRSEDDVSLVYDEKAPSTAVGQLEKGAFRSLIYGQLPAWSTCPGVQRFAPFLVCSTRTEWEQGRCEWREGVDNYGCVCNHGFYGNDCGLLCPGGYDNFCSNRGTCYTFNETFCECEAGYRGPACEFECPGWNWPDMPTPKECLGYGDCVMNDAGTDTECLCFEETGRYGVACERIYGEDTAPIVEAGCENCGAPFEQCIEGVCLCEEGYYRYFGVCKEGGSTLLAPLFTILAALVAVFAAQRLN